MTPEENVAAITPEDTQQPPVATPAELPPFSPPPDFQFEEELRGPAPRQIPSFVRQGRTMRRSVSVLKVLFYVGGISLVFAHAPFVKFLGQFILPLQYLDYFGYGLVGIGSVLWISHFLRPGVLQYISNGIPLLVRIRDLQLVPEAEMHGVVLRSAYVAVIESLNPETGGIAQLTCVQPRYQSMRLHVQRRTLRSATMRLPSTCPASFRSHCGSMVSSNSIRKSA